MINTTLLEFNWQLCIVIAMLTVSALLPYVAFRKEEGAFKWVTRIIRVAISAPSIIILIQVLRITFMLLNNALK